MSSTARGSDRHPDDFYSTPAWATRAILRTIEPPPPRRILEPTAGTGAISKLLREWWPEAEIVSVELDERRAETAGAVCGNFLEIAPTMGHFDLAITNPPFALAMDVIKATLPIATTTIMLLRLNFIGALERVPFWLANPADAYVLPKRPSFAASVKCGNPAKKIRGCGWKTMMPIDAPRPKKCPVCCGVRTVTTGDSCEYAWFAWGPGRGNRWWPLDIVEEAEPEAAE